VVRYAYLWTHEVVEGREEARKDRPCAVVIATTDAAGVSSVVVVPITSRAPAVRDDGMEIPAATRRRLGLQDEPCWAVLTEVNRFVWPGPDLRPPPTEAVAKHDDGLIASACGCCGGVVCWDGLG